MLDGEGLLVMMNGKGEIPSQEVAVRKLERIGAQLRESGVAELAEELDRVIEHLRELQPTTDVPGSNREILLTTGEAAEMLGIRSLNTIKKWAIDGLLDGCRRGGRIMITQASVERLLQKPLVSRERSHEAAEEEAWEPFDIGNRHPLPAEPWSGRKPWEARSTHAGDE